MLRMLQPTRRTCFVLKLLRCCAGRAGQPQQLTAIDRSGAKQSLGAKCSKSDPFSLRRQRRRRSFLRLLFLCLLFLCEFLQYTLSPLLSLFQSFLLCVFPRLPVPLLAELSPSSAAGAGAACWLLLCQLLFTNSQLGFGFLLGSNACAFLLLPLALALPAGAGSQRLHLNWFRISQSTLAATECVALAVLRVLALRASSGQMLRSWTQGLYAQRHRYKRRPACRVR
jgi:hypothetical protein